MDGTFAQLMATLEAAAPADLPGLVDRAVEEALAGDEAFRRFFVPRAHRVARGGAPMLLQAALAEPEASPVRAAAAAFVRSRAGEARWLLRTDRARFAAAPPLLRTVEGHLGGVTAVALDEARALLLSGGTDGSVRLWHAGSGAALGLLQTDGARVCALALHPDGARLVVGAPPYVEIWDLERRARLRQLASGLRQLQHVLVHPDGRRLVLAGGDRLIVRDLDGPVRLDRPCIPPGTQALALHPEGEHVVCSAGFRMIDVIELDTGETGDRPTDPGFQRARAELARAAAAPFVLLHPDRRRAIAFGADRRLHVWNVGERRVVATLQAHTGVVNAAALFADGRRLWSGAADGTLRLWDLEAPVPTGDGSSHVEPIVGAWLMASGERGVTVCRAGLLKLWDLEAGVCLTTQLPFWRAAPDHQVSGAAVLPDETVVLADNRGALKRVEMRSSRGRWRAAVGDGLYGVCADPAGRWLATAEGTTVRLWDAHAGAQVASAHAPPKTIFTGPLCAISPSAACAAFGASLLVVDPASGDVRATLPVDADVSAVAPWDGGVVAGAADGSVTFFELPAGRVVKRLRAHAGLVTSLSVHAGLLATASDDRSVRVFTAPGGAELARWALDAVPTACVIGDAARLLVGDETGDVQHFQLTPASRIF